MKRLVGCIDRGLRVACDSLRKVGQYVKDLHAVDGTLTPSDEASGEEREAQFVSLRDHWQSSTDAVHQQFAAVMSSFQAGLFVGGKAADRPADNLDLERWFKHPKSHERRIHGRCHAGVRIVQQGPTLLLALDAHVHPDGLFTVDDLAPYCNARVPDCQQQALNRGKIMRRARSRKKCNDLLADLERRYFDSS